MRKYYTKRHAQPDYEIQLYYYHARISCITLEECHILQVLAEKKFPSIAYVSISPKIFVFSLIKEQYSVSGSLVLIKYKYFINICYFSAKKVTLR